MRTDGDTTPEEIPMKETGTNESPSLADEKKAGGGDMQVVTTHVQAGTSHPSDVSFLEYRHFADIQRKVELEHEEPSIRRDGLRSVFTKKDAALVKAADIEGPPLSDFELEKINAARALRTAGWSSVFFLITTDILGPFNAPYAFSQVGFVPGAILYLFMGAIAAYTGIVLSQLFCRLDSPRYPIRTFGDLGHRLFGPWARHLCSVLQSLQLVINVGTIVLSNGQSVSQISKGNLCFAVCIVIWAFVGMIIGQIRTLKRYTGLANWAVWLNLLIIFISMGVISKSAPNVAAAQAAYGAGIASGPIHARKFVENPLWAKVNGIMNMVFAYGGAMIFPEMMAEMRRPWDFWKGMAMAQCLIFSCYMMYGAAIYHWQGQYTLPLAYQGIASYAWQTVGNVLALITGIIAAGLYGNIGIKITYINIIEDWFHGPPLTSPTGKKIWFVMCIVYWAVAFVIGSAIPQVQTIAGLVAAVCIFQFTYTFPTVFIAAYHVLEDASKADPPFVVGQRHVPVDRWTSPSRWVRGIVGNGIFTGTFVYKVFNFTLFLASIATACLGMYGSGTAIKVTFELGAATSFGCTPPV